jgi:hypothetical protein
MTGRTSNGDWYDPNLPIELILDELSDQERLRPDEASEANTTHNPDDTEPTTGELPNGHHNASYRNGSSNLGSGMAR